MTKRYHLALLALLVLAGLFGSARSAPALAVAQNQPPIAISVQIGYDGVYRFAEWFPVIVDIANDGPDIRGVLEWNFPGQHDEATFRRTIDLPRGSRKRVVLEVFARGFARNGQVRLLDGETPLISQDVNLESIDDSRFLIGVLSSDPALLNSLEALQMPGLSGAMVLHMDADTLPERAVALRGLNALFIHDIDSSVLTPAQREGLAQWVRLGGQLVFSGGLGAEKAAAGLADLLPVEITGEVAQGDLTPLGDFAGAFDTPPAAAPLSQARPTAEAALLPADAPLLFRRQYGTGTVTFSAFDFASLRGWTGEPMLWGQVLAPITTFAPGASARLNQIDLIQNVIQLPLTLPSAWVLLCFLVGYILVIGPLNYLLLRRLRRLELAWVTVPAVVLLFAAGLYAVGFGLRGGQSQLNQAGVVQAVEGEQRGFATTFIGLFSPRRSSYSLAFPADALVGETRGWNDMPGGGTPVLNNDGVVEVPDVLVDVGSVRVFVAESPVDVPLAIQSNVQQNGNDLSIEIRNVGQSALEDALVVRGDTFEELGTIAPGASQSVGLNPTQQNFPWAVSVPEDGLFNRRQMLTSLFSGEAFRFRDPSLSSNGMNERGVYLLAWVRQPALAVRVNGQEQPHDGLTLYMIRLKDASSQFALPNPAPAGTFEPTVTPDQLSPTPLPPTASPVPLTPTPTP
jgi:hypothetical protein